MQVRGEMFAIPPSASSTTSSSSSSSSSPPPHASGDTAPRHSWSGEPRVIYHDVLDRVQELKHARQLADSAAHPERPSPVPLGSLSAKPPAVVKALAVIGRKQRDAPPPPSGSSSDSGQGGGGGGGGGDDDGGSGVGSVGGGGKRLVRVLFDSAVYNSPTLPRPIVTVVDARGEERRVSYRGSQLEPLDVGSVVVFEDKFGGGSRAAYYVGEEEHQVFVAGNGVACAPILRIQHLLDEEEEEEDGRWRRGRGDASGGRDRQEQEMMARAQAWRQKALERFAGKSEGPESPHELFLLAADMGDPESFFYLSALQSAGLHGGQAGAGMGQARTWALCGAHAMNMNSNILLGYRFRAGHAREPRLCREAVHFYQEAVHELRVGREDAWHDQYTPPDTFRLGGEHGVGGWGGDADIGGGNGGAMGLGGGGGGAGMEGGPPRDVDMRDDVLLRAEAGDPAATLMLGYLYLNGWDAIAIRTDFAKAEQLMWKAIRNGEIGGYAYLAWMHHNGHIGGHLPPHLQPVLPDGGGRDDPRALNKEPGWVAGPKPEAELRELALAVWGQARLAKTRGGAGVAREGEANDDGDGEEKENGDGWRESRGPLREGEDVWGGRESGESWDWEVAGGGVSGAIAAADLYVKGFNAGDPACGTALADMWLHSEYSDTRDGRGAGGKWAMLQAYLLFWQSLEMGRQFGEPQVTAALRMGGMFQHGHVPFLGTNLTKAVEYYKESANNGGMDALLALADINLMDHKGDPDTCEAAAGYYERYARLCLKETALIDGRVAYEMGNYQEAFIHYLVAAEQGSPEGQASLAWLLDQALLAEDRDTSSDRVLHASSSSSGNGGRDGSSSGGGDGGGASELGEVGAEASPSAGVGDEGDDGIGGGVFDVAEVVRAMGGNPAVMARTYRRMAAEQGDADARCEIADHLYRLAKAKGVIPPGAGWLPWAKGATTATEVEGAGEDAEDIKTPGGFGPGRGTGYGRESEADRVAREGDGARLLSDAVGYYRLAGEAEGGGSRRALFAMGWLHQHGVGVKADRALARQYYRRSGSSPAIVGLWLMGASDVFAEVALPLLLSIVVVGVTMIAMKFLRGERGRGRRHRHLHRQQPDGLGGISASVGGGSVGVGGGVGGVGGEIGDGSVDGGSSVSVGVGGCRGISSGSEEQKSIASSTPGGGIKAESGGANSEPSARRAAAVAAAAAGSAGARAGTDAVAAATPEGGGGGGGRRITEDRHAAATAAVLTAAAAAAAAAAPFNGGAEGTVNGALRTSKEGGGERERVGRED